MTLPGGRVTFCFTDIEGSTALFARLGDAYLELLEVHRRLVRDAFAAEGGAEVKSEGDGFFFAFPSADGAVRAAVAAQLALAAEPWPDDRVVRVRMGLHTGEAEPYGEDYMVFAVHEAARVSATGHGGQVVVSATTRGDATGLGTEIDFADLGAHDLRDLPSPMQLFQVTHPGLPSTFPPLRSTPTRRENLPTPLSSYVARDEQLAVLSDLVATQRLVTVAGPGGSGKTRLALEAARGELRARPDGVWFVDLASVRDPAAVADAVLDAFGVAREPGMPALDQLRTAARSRHVLVVLDNCEHLLAGAAEAAEALLDQASPVAVLATSREPLGVDGEVVWRLSPMTAAEGRALFVARARHAGAALADDGAGDAAIDEVCARLDGSPLAIELAAARTTVLGPEQIAERLDDRFRLLTGGSRGLGRQQTLEAALDWSHDLLEEGDRTVLRRLSAFAGPFDLAGAEAVAGVEVLDGLARLVDKSLVDVVPARDRLRYRLLETVRSYAWDKLVASGEADDLRDRHLAHHVALARATAPGLFDGREVAAVETLREASANVRAALEWAISSADAPSAHELAGDLWLFWPLTGAVPEGLAWLERVLATDDGSDVDVDQRAKVLSGAAHLSYLARRPQAEVDALTSGVVERMHERGGRPLWHEVWAAMLAGGSTTAGIGLISDDALDAARRCGNDGVLATVLVGLAQEHRSAQRPEDALAVLDEAELVARRSGATSLVGYALSRQCLVVAETGDPERAVGIARDAVAAARRGPNVYFLMYALDGLGRCCAQAGDDAAATAAYEELLHVATDSGAALPAARAGLELAALAMAEGDFGSARLRLHDAHATLEAIAAVNPPAFLLLAMAGHAHGEAALLEGDLPTARRIFEAGATAAQGLGIAWVAAFTQVSLGWLALTEGDLDAAEAHHRAAAAAVGGPTSTHEASLHHQARAASDRGLAAVALARGDEALALALARGVADSVEPTDGTPRIATILFRRTMGHLARR